MEEVKTMIKKIFGMFLCVVLITNVFVIINAEEESVIKEKIESINFSEPNMQVENQFITLHMEEATSYLREPGKPILPVCTKIYTFPFGTKIKGVECKCVQINQKVLSGEIRPSPEPIPLKEVNAVGEERIVKDFVTKDNAVYNSMDFFPYKWYDYRVGCGLDDSRRMVFLTVQIYPIRYSPGRHMIQYVDTVDIKVKYDEPIQQVVFPDQYDMVVITPSEFSEKLRPLAEYNNDSNVATKLVTLEEIYDGSYFPVNGRDDQEKIKYFIKDAVEGWNITYVLLAGGANKIPVRMSYVQDGQEESFISDLYYADFYDASGDFCSWDSNGNNIFGEYGYQGRTDVVDLYPDVYLGRLNFRESSEVSDVVNKIITYESTGAYIEEWFHHFVVCGGDTFPDYSYVDEGEYLNQNAIDMMSDFIPEKIWATNGKLQFAANIDNAMNNGTGFLYMTGHGTFENWATHPHNDFETWWPIGSYFYFRIDVLNNKEKLPVVIVGGCSNFGFLEDHCFGWSFIKNPNGGGIASYGNTALGWSMAGTGCTQGLTGGMELSAIKAYGVQNVKTTGELWSNALNNYLNQFGAWSALDYKTIEEWQPFNDPSLRITKVSDKPSKPEKIIGPTSGEIGTEYTFTTSSTDPNGDLIKYCFDWSDSTTWTEQLNSGEDVSLNHTWEKPGTYEIKVKARDQYGLDSDWSDPLLVTIESEAPYLDIVKIKGGIAKVRAVIANIGSLEANTVDCNISVIGGMLGMIKIYAKETLGTLGINQEKMVTANKIFGIGKINITVTASAPLANNATKTAQGYIMWPLIFVQK
jgi:low affinity Fe/Cu permease